MPFFSFINRLFTRGKTAGEAPEAGAVTAPASGPRFGTEFWDIPMTTAMTVSTVYRCVQLLSDSVASLPLLVKRRKGELFVAADGDPLSFLLGIEPDAATSAHDWKKQIVVDLLLRGNAYIVPFYSAEAGGYMRLALCAPGTVGH